MGPRAQGWALDRRGQNHRGVHLWPYLRFQHLLNFAGNSFSTSISKLQAGKRRSKKPRSQFFAQKASVPLHNPAFPLFAPSQYLSSFSSYRPKSKKGSFFHVFSCHFDKIVCWPAVVSILIHIASLNRYTPMFSGVPQKLTWYPRYINLAIMTGGTQLVEGAHLTGCDRRLLA